MAPAPSGSVRTGAADGAPPADTGCDWQRVDARFGRCLTCPLPRCRYDYSWREQQAAAQVLQALLGQDQLPSRSRRPAAPPPRPPAPDHAGRVTSALPDGTLARIAQQALVRGRARR